jgi:hypothetical protein
MLMSSISMNYLSHRYGPLLLIIYIICILHVLIDDQFEKGIYSRQHAIIRTAP